LESFTGSRILAETSQARINDPCNAFNIESNARDYFDKLAWGIEAQQQAGGEVRYLVCFFDRTLQVFFRQWKYLYRPVRNQVPFTISLNDGDEIIFRRGQEGQQIDLPDPLFCNTRLAIARVMYACGASEFIDDLYGDDDDDEAIVTQPVYLGGPFVSDDILLRRLHDRLPVS